MSGNGTTNGAERESSLRSHLAALDRSREQIAKAWLIDVIENSRLSDLQQMPVAWASCELPLLVGDILGAVGTESPALDAAGLRRVAELAELRSPCNTPAQLTRELSSLHSVLLSTMRMKLASKPALYAEAADRLAALFAQVAPYAVAALGSQAADHDRPAAPLDGQQLLRRLQQLVAASKRYGSPFGLLVFDVEGPGARPGESGDGNSVWGAVSRAVQGSIRLTDEAFQSEADGLCVLAPNQSAADASQMAHRLAEVLERLQREAGLRITVSTGVVACPEHGDHPRELLHAADAAMWRARATGRPVTVAASQDR